MLCFFVGINFAEMAFMILLLQAQFFLSGGRYFGYKRPKYWGKSHQSIGRFEIDTSIY